MKNTSKLKSDLITLLIVLIIFLVPFLLTSCNDDEEPVREDTPELITRITLTFTPDGGGDPVIATATDPDGIGSQPVVTDGPINLSASTSYALDITLVNELADPQDEGYNISEEVEEEGEEHMFFFGWTNDLFVDPAGDGNIDNRADAVMYIDEDASGEPLGLLTSWTTGEAATGEFRIILKHQPELKTATSGATVGETDLDIAFDIEIQ